MLGIQRSKMKSRKQWIQGKRGQLGLYRKQGNKEMSREFKETGVS